MALGAPGAGLVRRMVAPLAAGLFGGLLLSLVITSGLSSCLFGVGTRDPVTFGGAVALLATVCPAGSYLPARRVTKLQPTEVLKS